MANAFAIIMAGGNGERFWPVSTAARPKQFVSIFGGKPLIAHAIERLRGLIPLERTFVITAERFVAMTQEALPTLPKGNIIAEPCRRDTAAAVATAVGLVKKNGGDDAIGCVLTADQLIEPAEKFRTTLADAINVAAEHDSIITLGIVPDKPATGFGYIEHAAELEIECATKFCAVKRFVEKPNAATAAKYIATGRFSWNAGMFIWRAAVMEHAFALNAPDFVSLIATVAATDDITTTLRTAYPPLRAISVDYAVMEHAKNIIVAQCDFRWDDVGSWLALANHFSRDDEGNTCLGNTALLDTAGSVIVAEDGHLTTVVGMRDVVVVHTANATLVCAKDRVQDVKKLVQQLTK